MVVAGKRVVVVIGRSTCRSILKIVVSRWWILEKQIIVVERVRVVESHLIVGSSPKTEKVRSLMSKLN